MHIVQESQQQSELYIINSNSMGGVMVSVFASSDLDCGFEHLFFMGQTKDYKIDMCCFSSKH